MNTDSPAPLFSSWPSALEALPESFLEFPFNPFLLSPIYVTFHHFSHTCEELSIQTASLVPLQAAGGTVGAFLLPFHLFPLGGTLCHPLLETCRFSWLTPPSRMDSSLQCFALSSPHPQASHTKTSFDFVLFFFRKSSSSNTSGPFPRCSHSLALTVVLLPSVDYYYLLFISRHTVLCLPTRY